MVEKLQVSINLKIFNLKVFDETKFRNPTLRMSELVYVKKTSDFFNYS